MAYKKHILPHGYRTFKEKSGETHNRKILTKRKLALDKLSFKAKSATGPYISVCIGFNSPE